MNLVLKIVASLMGTTVNNVAVSSMDELLNHIVKIKYLRK